MIQLASRLRAALSTREGRGSPGQLMVMEAPGVYRRPQPTEVIAAAQALLAKQVPDSSYLDSPATVRGYLACKLAGLAHEVFGVVLLTSQLRVIEYVELFRGTLTHTSVHPREVVKEALRANAGCLIAVHNHPSGCTNPSPADEHVTSALRNALQLVDVRLIDHLIVGLDETLSMAEKGLM